MKRFVTGILAHVDSGKTTLSEAMLYLSGSIRKLGRVDNRDAFLDTDELERKRGITIFSKQAELECGDLHLTLLDTPGHVDFSSETERTLQVLDYAILVISGADGVQGHTMTLWKLLEKYDIPVFLFINKMDQPGTVQEHLLTNVQAMLSENCVDFTRDQGPEFFEQIASMGEEDLLETYLDQGKISQEQIQELVWQRQVFPCYFGSALKLEGVEALLRGLEVYSLKPWYPTEFGARVYKISRDGQDHRLTHLKVTGGSLEVKTQLGKEDKVNQIRIYSGEKYETVPRVEAGQICAVTGLTKTWPGQGLGYEEQDLPPQLEPVLHYQIQLPEGTDPAVVLPKLRLLEEEDPQLHIVWNETLQEIQAQLMGEVQVEILKSLIEKRFGLSVEFGSGNIVYKETILDMVEGVGHFEPLRHYAEVHLILEPLERGMGLLFDTDCSEDVLDRNWQRLILTHLLEKEHKGVLMGAPITDVHITVASGRAHPKHTEGGDFRQATYRAVRQGLRQARSVLLEPWYRYRLELPSQMVGRGISDLERMGAAFNLEAGEQDYSILTGRVPVSEISGYQRELAAYAKGKGRLFLEPEGYDVCHNTQEVLEQNPYDPDHDLDNPSDSVFCSHGSGFSVKWDEVPAHMHMESVLAAGHHPEEETQGWTVPSTGEDPWLDPEEIDAILERTYHANRKEGFTPHKGINRRRPRRPLPRESTVRSHADRVLEKKRAQKRPEYLLVDGYNVIFAWESLRDLAQTNLDGARGKLLDILCNYQALQNCHLIAVFDAYRVKGHATEELPYHNIYVVYTKEAQTADSYIEKFSHENASRYDVTVATSDGLEQIIITGKGAKLLSAREFEKEVQATEQRMKEDYQGRQEKTSNRLLDNLSRQGAQALEAFQKEPGEEPGD